MNAKGRPDTATDLETRIARYIKGSPYTQAEIATAVGLSRQACTARIAGRTQWEARDIPILADLFGVEPGDLFLPADAPYQAPAPRQDNA